MRTIDIPRAIQPTARGRVEDAAGPCPAVRTLPTSIQDDVAIILLHVQHLPPSYSLPLLDLVKNLAQRPKEADRELVQAADLAIRAERERNNANARAFLDRRPAA